VWCRALAEDAGELGSDCDGDADCATGWCDPDQRRCSAACTVDDDCPHEMGWCYPEWLAVPRRVCLFGCRGAADCSGGLVCTPQMRVVDDEPVFSLVTVCNPPLGDLGPGEFCTGYNDCRTNACTDWPYVCSTICAADADCLVPDAVGSWCAPYRSDVMFAAPADWPVPTFGVCRPEELRP
jgi:hypothetical protein